MAFYYIHHINIKYSLTMPTTKIKLLLVDRAHLTVVNARSCDVDVTTSVCHKCILMRLVLLYLNCLKLESEIGRPSLSETSEI